MNWNPARWFVKDQGEEYSLSDDAVLQAVFNVVAATASGVRVNQQTALASTAVLACLIVRSETFSTLPVRVLREDAGSLTPFPKHPSYPLLAVAWNDLLTAGEGWRWKQLAEDITGNAYVRVEWSPRGGRPFAFWPLTGPRPRLVRTQKGLSGWEYRGDELTPSGTYSTKDVLHFKGAVLRTPYEGASLIDLASEAIGTAIGTEQFFGRLLGNGTHFPAYLQTDSTLKQEDRDALRDQIKGTAGILPAGQLRIFDRGLKVIQNEMSMKDAQLNEQELRMLQKICGVFRMPLAMVQDMTHGTYSNSEQQDLWLAKHTITPICVDTERVLRHRLYAGEPTVRAKWNLDGLQRGDYKTRTEGDATLTRAGIIDRNEARSHYDYNPRPGLDLPLAELNLGTVSEDGTITGADKGAQANVADIMAPVLRDAVACIRRRDRDDRKRGRDRVETEAFATAKLAPVIESFASAGAPFDAHAFITTALAREPAPTLTTDEGSAT